MGDAPTLSSVLDSVRPLAEAGASLHWLVPFEKRPLNKNWSAAPRLSLQELKAAHRPSANVGIRLGEPSRIGGYYLHLIDLDITRPELVETVWAKLIELCPDARHLPSVISGSGGASRHIYFLTDKPFRKKVLSYEKGAAGEGNLWEIVLMGTGSQAVIPPSIHPDTRQAYRWAALPDLDFPDLMSLPSALVESWGAKEDRPLDEGDDDDLETLFNNSPLDLSDDEIEATLAALPNEGVGAHYDEYIEVGMALHHQYQGSEEGFEKWVAWAEQSEKFDEKHARYRWDKSFGETRSSPVTFRTLIQKANANRLAGDHDFDLDLNDAPTATGTALVPYDPYSLDDLLGGDPLPKTAEAQPVTRTALSLDWQMLFHRNAEGELRSTSHNIGLIVANDIRLRGVIAFNEFLQEVVVRAEPKLTKSKRDSAKPVVNLTSHIWRKIDPLNGNTFTDSHENAIRMLIEAPTTQGGYGIKVSDRDLRAAIDAAAHEWRFHPIKTKLEQVTWDGVKRMERLFIDYLGAADTPYHRETAVKTMVAAVTRIYEPGHKFDYVPILEGVQGKRKSTFIETLAFGWFAELEGDFHDRKAMVEKMQGAWIMELPELQGFSKAEVTTIKGFVSARQDKVRPAYARRSVIFYRQCIFMGSTNEDEYLRDTTGGRRFWPIHCAIEGDIDIMGLEHNLPQLWAEALHEYRTLREAMPHGTLALYLNTKDAAEEALLLQSSRSQESSEQSLAGEIAAWLDRPLEDGTGFDDLDANAPKVYRNETCMAQVWREMMGRSGPIPPGDRMTIGAALKNVGWKRTVGPTTGMEINKKYGKTRVYYRP